MQFTFSFCFPFEYRAFFKLKMPFGSIYVPFLFPFLYTLVYSHLRIKYVNLFYFSCLTNHKNHAGVVLLIVVLKCVQPHIVKIIVKKKKALTKFN